MTNIWTAVTSHPIRCWHKQHSASGLHLKARMPWLAWHQQVPWADTLPCSKDSITPNRARWSSSLHFSAVAVPASGLQLLIALLQSVHHQRTGWRHHQRTAWRKHLVGPAARIHLWSRTQLDTSGSTCCRIRLYTCRGEPLPSTRTTAPFSCFRSSSSTGCVQLRNVCNPAIVRGLPLCVFDQIPSL